MAANASLWWSTVNVIADAAAFLVPLFLFVATLAWVRRRRCVESVVGVIGGFLGVVGHLTQRLVHLEFSVVGSPVPAPDESGFVFFVAMYGSRIGLLLLSAALAVYFCRPPRTALSPQEA
jgi:hypothetical protein